MQDTQQSKRKQIKTTIKMNTERLTTCIKHLAVSGLSSVSARIKSSCNLIGNRFEMPNVSYTQPLCNTMRRKDNQHKYYKNGNLAHFNSNRNNRVYC